MRSTLIVLFLVVLTSNVFAQKQPNPCGYTGFSPWLDWYHQNKHQITERGGSDTSWLYVPITIHIVGNNSPGSYYPQEQVFRILCQMNEQFAEGRIRYYLHPQEPFVYHNNQSWYEHDWSGGAEMINTTKLPDRVNAYIVNDPAGNCGYAWFDAIVMGKGCSGFGNSTWAHEAGHHLSLPHPFFGWEGFSWNFSLPAPEDIDGYPVERMDTTNCYFSGDRFCDTRPDYLNYRWTCDDQQQSNVQQLDPEGVPFRSDASLIMGYSLDACTSRFTPEQIEAMRANLRTEHVSYLQEDEAGPELINDGQVNLISPVDSQQVQFNSVQLNWEPIPGAKYYAVQVALSPAFSFFLYNKVVSGSSVTLTSGIPNNRTMFWRVRAFSDWDLCDPDNYVTGIFKTKNLTATNDLERVAQAELIPNPVAVGLPARLFITADERMNARLRVTNSAGMEVFAEAVQLSTGDNQLDIPTGRLSAGFYLVSLQNEKGAIVKRLIVTE